MLSYLGEASIVKIAEQKFWISLRHTYYLLLREEK